MNNAAQSTFTVAEQLVWTFLSFCHLPLVTMTGAKYKKGHQICCRNIVSDEWQSYTNGNDTSD